MKTIGNQLKYPIGLQLPIRLEKQQRRPTNKQLEEQQIDNKQKIS